MYGYAGKILRVNLKNQNVRAENIKSKDLRIFLGGVGYAAKILYEELPKAIDPLGPRNKIVFATGPLTGTKALGSGSLEVCFKSPLTNIWAEARCGSTWGPFLKSAGYDFLVVEGKSAEPVFITIDNETVEIKPAVTLRGKMIYEKIAIVRKELGDRKIPVAAIGPAGEKLVRFANIMIGGRAAGRCGGGAVMGSKNLLAVAVKGSDRVKVAKPEEFSAIVKETVKTVIQNPASSAYKKGTLKDMPTCDATGDFPTKNWRSNSWGKGDQLFDHWKNNNYVQDIGCYPGCIMPCGKIARVASGKWKTPEHEGSEYESIAAFTAFMLNEDVDAAVHATYLCNIYGLDTISCGAAIAFAMDCYTEGIITEEDVNNLELRWGNPLAVIEMVKKISKREGVGKILGEGVMRAAKKFGNYAKKLAVHVKGLEGPAHDPRSGKALALMYGTGNRGMCHIHPCEGMAYDNYKTDFGLTPYGIPDPQKIDRFAEEGKGVIAKTLQDFGIVPDILGVCKFYTYVGVGPEEYAAMVSTLTGWDIDGNELLKIGERAYNLQRMFNVREGISRKDDALPERICRKPEFGKYSSYEKNYRLPEFSRIRNYYKMLKELYVARGWNSEGAPTEEKLKELGLNNI